MSMLKHIKCKYIVRRFSSVLYVTGDKAQKTFAVLTPVIDFETQLHNKSKVQKNIHVRNLDINFDDLEKRWRFFKDLEKQKATLENTRSKIGQNISELMKNELENGAKIEQFKLHLKIVKEDLKNLKEYYYEVEEGTMLQILNLPNDLHAKTPEKDELCLHNHLLKPEHKSEPHLKIGKGFLKYIDNYSCYLKSTAALFELALLNYFQQSLLNRDYNQFSNPDFTRSIVIEGCGIDFRNNLRILTLEESQDDKNHGVNRLHLSGTASLYPFMAYFTRHFVQPNYFPLKYFAVGRKYLPIKKNEPSLFGVCQNSVVSTFIASKSGEDLLESTIKEIIDIYEKLGYHYRLVLNPARNLELAESLRLSIQMFSNNLNEYVEVGNISLYEDYLSKRLLFTYSEGKERRYPYVIAANVVNVHKVLGCVLENYVDKNLLSDFLKKYIPG